MEINKSPDLVANASTDKGPDWVTHDLTDITKLLDEVANCIANSNKEPD